MKHEASIIYEIAESHLRSPPNSGIHIEPSYRCSQKSRLHPQTGSHAMVDTHRGHLWMLSSIHCAGMSGIKMGSWCRTGHTMFRCQPRMVHYISTHSMTWMKGRINVEPSTSTEQHSPRSATSKWQVIIDGSSQQYTKNNRIISNSATAGAPGSWAPIVASLGIMWFL